MTDADTEDYEAIYKKIYEIAARLEVLSDDCRGPRKHRVFMEVREALMASRRAQALIEELRKAQ